MVTAITLTYAEEAIGITRAAAGAGLPAAISFTVETDGRLPSGQALAEAIGRWTTRRAALPRTTWSTAPTRRTSTHVLGTGEPWEERIRGLRANASTKSHAELDEAEELDEGDPGGPRREVRGARREAPVGERARRMLRHRQRHVAAITRPGRTVRCIDAASYAALRSRGCGKIEGACPDRPTSSAEEIDLVLRSSSNPTGGRRLGTQTRTHRAGGLPPGTAGTRPGGSQQPPREVAKAVEAIKEQTRAPPPPPASTSRAIVRGGGDRRHAARADRPRRRRADALQRQGRGGQRADRAKNEAESTSHERSQRGPQHAHQRSRRG